MSQGNLGRKCGTYASALTSLKSGRNNILLEIFEFIRRSACDCVLPNYCFPGELVEPPSTLYKLTQQSALPMTTLFMKDYTESMTSFFADAVDIEGVGYGGELKQIGMTACSF